MIIIKKSVFLIISILAIAALAVCGVIVTKRLNNNANPDYIPPPPAPELKTGNYYLNGDKNSGLWVEVYPDYLTLNGDDVDASIKAAIIKLYEENGDTPTGEGFQKMLEDTKQLYCAKKRYTVKDVGLESYFIEVSRKGSIDEELSQPHEVFPENRDESAVYRGEYYDSKAAFNYNGKDTIYLGAFGDFILVD